MDDVELLKHDHRMVEQLLCDDDAARSDGQRRGVVEILVRELSKHAALRELGSELEAQKKLAPTRPHPGAPDQPPALALAAPFVAIYDRFRDRVQGRPLT